MFTIEWNDNVVWLDYEKSGDRFFKSPHDSPADFNRATKKLKGYLEFLDYMAELGRENDAYVAAHAYCTDGTLCYGSRNKDVKVYFIRIGKGKDFCTATSLTETDDYFEELKLLAQLGNMVEGLQGGDD